MIIYLIRNKTNGMAYVGQTIRPLEVRWTEHCRGKDLVVDRAIQKHGVDNFEICTLAETDNLQDLNALEVEHIAKQGTFFPSGYNLTTGGQTNAAFTAEVRERLKVLATGRKLSQEAKDKIGNANRGKKKPPRTPEHIANLIASNTGRKHRGGWHHTQDAKDRIALGHRKLKTPEVT